MAGLLPALAAPNVAAAPTTIDRLSGADRYATGVEVSKAAYPAAGVPVAYVATGENFPDALAGGAAASHAGGPLLLVTKDAVPAVVATELTRLKPKRIVILGGNDVVTDAVATALDAFTIGTVTRVAGTDRYATALATSRDTFSGAVGGSVIIATGENYPDALSAGSLFAGHGGPVLLAQPGSGLTPALVAELARLKPSEVLILGGADVVSEIVVADLTDLGYEPTRLAGVDRYATSAAIARFAYPAGHAPKRVLVTTGKNFPDGVTAGPLAAVAGAPVLLAGGICWDAATLTFLQTASPTRYTYIGGPGVVPEVSGTQLDCASPLPG